MNENHFMPFDGNVKKHPHTYVRFGDDKLYSADEAAYMILIENQEAWLHTLNTQVHDAWCAYVELDNERDRQQDILFNLESESPHGL